MERHLESVSSIELSSESVLDRKSHLPLYVQIKRELLRRIAAWPSSERRFYSDEELCAEFDVSRMTVRQAVRELVDEGYLTRARGLGTFLSSRKVQERPLASTVDRLSFDGTPFELVQLKLSQTRCPDVIAEALRIARGQRVFYVLRLRRAGSVPISLDERWLPLDCGRGLTRVIVESQSLVRFLGERHKLSNVHMQFEGGVAGKSDASALEILEGDPVLIRHLAYETAEARIVMAGRSIHRSDLARYAVTLPFENEPS